MFNVLMNNAIVHQARPTAPVIKYLYLGFENDPGAPLQDCSRQSGSGTAILHSDMQTTPTFAHSLVQVIHKCGTAMAVPTL